MTGSAHHVNRAGGSQNLSALSTSVDSSGLSTSYQNLNISDIESDDSFECEDQLMEQLHVDEDDEESIIVA